MFISIYSLYIHRSEMNSVALHDDKTVVGEKAMTVIKYPSVDDLSKMLIECRKRRDFWTNQQSLIEKKLGHCKEEERRIVEWIKHLSGYRNITVVQSGTPSTTTVTEIDKLNEERRKLIVFYPYTEEDETNQREKKINITETLKAWSILDSDGALIKPNDWCRWCGTRVSSGFRFAVGIEPPMRLCQAHAARSQRWTKNKSDAGIDLTPYQNREIMKPLFPDQECELRYIQNIYRGIKRPGRRKRKTTNNSVAAVAVTNCCSDQKKTISDKEDSPIYVCLVDKSSVPLAKKQKRSGVNGTTATVVRDDSSPEVSSQNSALDVDELNT
jgi:hypothetical protein